MPTLPLTNLTTVALKGPSLAARRDLPPEIAKKMQAWREGWGGLPKGYVEFHFAIAVEILSAFVAEHGVRVVEVKLARSGWLDGMEEAHAIVEDRSGNVHKLEYHDGNQGFLHRAGPGGGAGYFNPAVLFR